MNNLENNKDRNFGGVTVGHLAPATQTLQEKTFESGNS